MRKQRIKLSVTITILLFYICTTCQMGNYAAAETNNALTPEQKIEAQALLQKGLNIHEIDRELARLHLQDEQLAAAIKETDQDIAKGQDKVHIAKKSAAKVLRAYYTGDRSSLWMLLISMDSLADLLKTYEYLQMIINNDHLAIHILQQSVKDLDTLNAQREQQRSSLQASRVKYERQRDLIVRLQQELDTALAGTDQADAIRKAIETLNDDWQHKGVPLFEQYLQQLVVAMQSFPELVSAASENGSFSFSGLSKATFTLTDKQLNDFLRQKNSLFNSLTLSFTGGEMVVVGKQDEIGIQLNGKYELDDKDGLIHFHILELQFNGFTLPSTTAEEMERKYDLGIDPKKISGLFKVTEIRTEEHNLIVNLSLSF
jgi:peptidoglycan hydrolase CwlO-like protein